MNSITKKNSFSLPRIDACLDALRGSTWFSTLDLRSGDWQVRQDPIDADKTAFVTRRGCFRFKVLSFGLTGAPSLFQRLMDMVMSGLTWTSALCYLDDIVVFVVKLRTALNSTTCSVPAYGGNQLGGPTFQVSALGNLSGLSRLGRGIRRNG